VVCVAEIPLTNLQMEEYLAVRTVAVARRPLATVGGLPDTLTESVFAPPSVLHKAA